MRQAMGLLVAPVLLLAACTDAGKSLERNADRELSRAGLSEMRVPIGPLFDNPEGAVCIIRGEVDALEFSPSVPASLHNRIARELSRRTHRYVDNNIYLFDEEGALTDFWSVHWRSGTFWMSGPDGSDLDACLGAEDTILVQRGSVIHFALIYSLPVGAGDE